MKNCGIKKDRLKFLNGIIIKIKKIFNIITKIQLDKNHYLYIIPKLKNEKKINRIIKKKPRDRIILSKELKRYEQILKIKKDKNILKYLSHKILEYLWECLEKEPRLQNVYLLINNYNEDNKKVIENFLKIAKNITIITTDIHRFKKYEEDLYKNRTILITITNNKNKALKKAEYIINIDFTNTQINSYRINRNSIVINCSNEKLNILSFEGIIVNNVDIELKKEEAYNMLYEDFNSIDIYENFIFDNNKKYNNKIKIKNLIGNNGIICKKELLKVKKALTN